MKNKEPKKKWTGKKQIWYGAAGLFCLVAAVLVLILGNGMGAQAESRGDYNIDIFKYRETPIWLHRYPSC